MKTILFKTKKLAEEYISKRYPEVENGTYMLRKSSITERRNYTTDMDDFQWCGETPALDVLDENFNTIGTFAWWEDGDDKYDLFVGDMLIESFDNNYDARKAYDKALEKEENKDEEDEDVFEVKLFCNGEDISR